METATINTNVQLQYMLGVTGKTDMLGVTGKTDMLGVTGKTDMLGVTGKTDMQSGLYKLLSKM